jgi:hypothetical protein
MDEFSTTSDTFDQAEEEEILIYTASDEALEAAADTGGKTASLSCICYTTLLCGIRSCISSWTTRLTPSPG